MDQKLNLDQESFPKPKANVTNADIAASWREMVAAGSGRKYYYNTVTMATMWEMPTEYAAYLERIKEPIVEERSILEDRFLRILIECGVTGNMRWEEALRLIISHPHYKAVPCLADRKVLFTRHAEEQRAIEREKILKQREDDLFAFHTMLERTLPKDAFEILKSEEAMELIKDEPEFRTLSTTKERVDAYKLFVSKMRQQSHDRRTRGLSQLAFYLERMKIGHGGRSTWRTLERSLMNDFVDPESINFKEYPDIPFLKPLDRLLAYEDHMRGLERKAEESRRQIGEEKRRKSLHARTAFAGLLNDLFVRSKLNALSCWQDVLELVYDRPEFSTMIEVSSPNDTCVEIFWRIITSFQSDYIRDACAVISMIKKEQGPDNWRKHVLNPMILAHLEKNDASSSGDSKSKVFINIKAKDSGEHSSHLDHDSFLEADFKLRKQHHKCKSDNELDNFSRESVKLGVKRIREEEESDIIDENRSRAASTIEPNSKKITEADQKKADDRTLALIERLRLEHRDLLDRLKNGIKRFNNPTISIDSSFEELHPLLVSRCTEYAQDLYSVLPNRNETYMVQKYYFEKYIRYLRTKKS